MGRGSILQFLVRRFQSVETCKSVQYFLGYSGFKSRPSFSMILYFVSVVTVRDGSFISLDGSKETRNYHSECAYLEDHCSICRLPDESAASHGYLYSCVCVMVCPSVRSFTSISKELHWKYCSVIKTSLVINLFMSLCWKFPCFRTSRMSGLRFSISSKSNKNN